MTLPLSSANLPLREAARLGARVAALGLAMAALSGCQSIQSSTVAGPSIRFVNASTDPAVPGLDIYQNTTSPIIYNLGSGFITSYIGVAPGTYTFYAYAHDTKQSLVSARQTLVSPKQYTAIIGNVAANLQETIVQDQSSAAPTGQISVRFIDESTKAGALDIYVVPSSGKLTTSTPLATNVTFTQNTGYLNVPVDTYAIVIVPTGTVPVATTTTLYTGANTAYAAGAVRTYIIIDNQVATSPAVKVIEARDYDSPSATI